MAGEQVPNLLRLYLNPYVAQTCYCLDRLVRNLRRSDEDHQSFLANSFDEALGGALKLARCAASAAGRPTTGLVLDPAGRLGPFVDAPVPGGRVVFIPGLQVITAEAVTAGQTPPLGLIVLVATTNADLERYAGTLHTLIRRDAPLVLVCLEKGTACFSAAEGTLPPFLRELRPDIVVFDESFVEHAVPFGAFTAPRRLYGLWNRPGKTTFHSTTYQPNTISTRHFLRCLDPELHAALAHALERITTDLDFRADVFRRLYSPSLAKMIRLAGFDTADVRAAGDFVHVGGRRIFDAVSGVACSIRGHNPPTYVEEIERLDDTDCETVLAERLHALTGLEHLLPAVSGASAVESALKLALVAQHPRRHILALKAGFGGKTLLALAGTANPAYKENLDPLYPDVLYVDPFAADAETQLDAVLAAHPVAVVQLELIQAVGGVRPIPERVVRHLATRRRDAGYLLLIDEVQTGMYRSGPLSLARDMGLSPDLLLLGKGTSDMMFPFALVLYSATVHDLLHERGSDLPAVLHRRHAYDQGFATVLNVLNQAEQLALPERVAASAALFRQLLTDGLAGCKTVRAVRVHGLLIGIELDADRWPQRWFRKQLYSFYLYNLLRHRCFPALVGFCQYEPNVLKITPALTVAPEQVRALCAAIVDVLRRPFPQLLAAVLGGLLRNRLRPRRAASSENPA